METTETLTRACQRVLKASFKEVLEGFKPDRAFLTYRQQPDLDFEMLCYRGFPDPPDLSLPEFQIVQECLSQAKMLDSKDNDRAVYCLPVVRPPEGSVLGVLYLEADRERKGLQDQILSIEFLTARCGAEIAVLWNRLISKKQRLLATSDQVDTWSGVRRAGLEASEAGVQDMAFSFLERAIAMAEEWGPCPELGASLNDYGQALMASGRHDEAREQFERGISILEQSRLERNAESIPLLNNLAEFYCTQGEYSEAERLYQLSLEILSKEKQEDSATAETMANLGTVSLAMGDPSTARNWFQQALSSSARVFGDDHPDTIAYQYRLDEL
jgi:tetratricopeptide (TPR) repeat protein